MYRPYLKELNITYTQYIAMLVLWDESELTVKELGEALFLDSGTLTPVLKSLEAKGYVKRKRSGVDERSVILTVTEEGEFLKQNAVKIPIKVAKQIGLSVEEAHQLYTLLYKILPR